MGKITSVLIANRGEIAIRIIKTLQRLKIQTVAVVSSQEKSPMHARWADRVLELSGTTLAETYLNGDQLIQLCKKNHIDAIHPGYGFLSENSKFAAACRDAGVIFIGPSPEAIASMGSKAQSKELMIKAGVPTIPGYNGDDQSEATLTREALKIGFPVLLKASAGGGGKGMRVVHSEDALAAGITGAKSEGMKSFGDDRLIVEKYLVNPRHIEFQVFGDQHGNLIHLGERECSIQRRHQKIIEESPSPALNEELRAKMGATAVACAKAIGYSNAGTVEMILDSNHQYYFLEMNTRLQVEHPITELVTGFDLVEWQIRIAEGEKLPATQDQVRFRGHAIECRVYAEDPENGFLPAIGPVLLYQEPTSPFLRIDSAVAEGSVISIDFDPMIAKVISGGATREEAITRSIWALQNYPILGVKTNQSFLIAVLNHAAFHSGTFSTHFIAEHFPEFRDLPNSELIEAFSRMLNSDFSAAAATGSAPQSSNSAADAAEPNIWNQLSSFRIGGVA